MEKSEFIKQMMILGSQFDNTEDEVEMSMIMNDAEILYDNQIKFYRMDGDFDCVIHNLDLTGKCFICDRQIFKKTKNK